MALNGRYIWQLSLDIVVLRCGVCMLDASSTAMREALRNTRLPKVRTVMEGGNGEDGRNGGGGGGGGSSKNDLMVNRDIC